MSDGHRSTSTPNLFGGLLTWQMAALLSSFPQMTCGKGLARRSQHCQHVADLTRRQTRVADRQIGERLHE
jgi:hypothetical protein